MPVGYIYKFTLTTTGKIYVGKRQRSKFDRNYWGSGIYWTRAVKNYGGRKAVKREVLEWCETHEQLNVKEKYWIEKLNARNSDVGYNIAPGGDGGNLGEDVVKKIVAKNKGRIPWNKGKKNVYSVKTKAKMSKAKRDKKSWNAGKIDIYSDETIAKMKKAAYNRSTHKKIHCIELDRIYNTAEDVCIGIGVECNSDNKTKILRCCEGYRKSFNNLHFKFKEN